MLSFTHPPCRRGPLFAGAALLLLPPLSGSLPGCLPGSAPGLLAQAAPGDGSASAGGSELPELPGLCTLEGKVKGSDGGIVPGAVLTLLGEGKVAERIAESDDDGDFVMEHVPCGTFFLSVTMAGFQPASLGGSLPEGGGAVQMDVVLRLAGQNASVNVVATQQEIAEAQVHLEEQQRLGGVVPNFFVSYQWSAAPLHARQKFNLALHNAVDPVNLLLAGVFAGTQQATDSYQGYGQGAAGYGRRYGANLGNGVIGTFLGGAILPSIFRQDPRYFYRGTGTVRSRAWYAVSRAFVTRGDNGKTEVNASGILGNLGTGALSNLYAAKEDRQGSGVMVSNSLLGVGGDCFNNLLQEFLFRRFTTKPRISPGAGEEGTGRKP